MVNPKTTVKDAPTGRADYGAKDITVLEGLEAVRKRPGMYIGSTGIVGIQHLIYEIVDNGVDEAMAGYASEISIVIHKDGSVTVQDDGRGIPVDTHARTGKSALETVLTTLHAGGKFGDKGYQVSGGLHGVGASVVNALSRWLKVEVSRYGQLHTMGFERGKVTQGLQAEAHPIENAPTGTTISWMPDDTIFEEINYDFNSLIQRFKEMSYLNPGLRLRFRSDWHEDEHAPHNRQSFFFDGGVQSFVRNYNRRRAPNHPTVFYASKDVDGIMVDVAMQYNESFTESCFSFANCIRTGDGGTHVTGFRSALTRVINDFARKKNILKNGVSGLAGDDTREGLVSVISVKVKDPQFEGQTKGRLGNPEVKGAVEQFIGRSLTEFLEDHPQDLDQILNKALTAARARDAAKKARELIIRKNAMDGGALPGKLADCTERDPRKSEIFIVEGESAGGSAKQGRDRYFQAILPIKGKILNVEKARIDKILSHDEILALITAIGAGVGEEFNLEQLRYHKIIVMTDADVDGAHIRTLLLTFFFRHMRELVDAGNLYIAQPPLYRVSKGRSHRWIYEERSLNEYLANNLYGNIQISNSAGYEIKGSKIVALMEQLKSFITNLAIAKLSDKTDRDLSEYLATELERRQQQGTGEVRESHPEVSLWMNELNKDAEEDTNGELVSEEPRPIIAPSIEENALDRLLDTYEELKPLIDGGGFSIHNKETEVATDVPWRNLLERLERLTSKSGISIQRYKGLGEMNPDQLWDTTMNPEVRTLTQVEVEDAEMADEIFRTLMGDDVEPRRNFIRANALKVSNLDI